MRAIRFISGLLILASFTKCQEPYVEEDDAIDAANAARPRSPEEEPKYPDGVNTIPGSADRDYPTYSSIFKTSFRCAGRPPGFYGDVEARCQIWHTCDMKGHQQSFLCPNGTIYAQANRVCDWWYNVNCELEEVERNYRVNEDLYQVPQGSGKWSPDTEIEYNKPREPNEVQRPKPTQREPLPPPPKPHTLRHQNTPSQNSQQVQRPREPFPTQATPNQGQPRNPRPLPPAIAAIDRSQILAILNSNDQQNSHLSDEERFPLKYKLKRQREAEAERLRKLEQGKLAAALAGPGPTARAGPPPTRVVQVDQNQNKPAIIRLTNQFGVDPPRQPVYAPRGNQGQYTQAQATPTTTRPYTQPPTRPTTTTRPYTQPPTTRTTPAEDRPRPQDNYVRPTTQEETERKFEGTEESKFPQQQARQFPSYSPSNRPRIEDPPINTQEERQQPRRGNPSRGQESETKGNPQQQRAGGRFQSDVNADGNRFQNGESRQQGQGQQRQRQPVRRPQPRQEENRFQTNSPQESVQEHRPRQQPPQQQQQSRNQNNYRQENRRPIQEQVPEQRPRDPQPQRRPEPVPEQPRPISNNRFDNDGPAPASAHKFAAPESQRQKFRHSTPRRHNVQFAPSNRPNRDIDEISEETIHHPVPSFYNTRFPIQQFITIAHPTTAATAAPSTPAAATRVYSSRPTPLPETVQPLIALAPTHKSYGNSSPTIVRIIVKQKVHKPEPQPERRVSTGSEEEPLDVREESGFFERVVPRGKYRS